MVIDCIIPARGGSKGVPKKNIKMLGDYPLIAYSIVAANLSKNIRKTIVTTDSQEIADIALKYGAEVPYLRPSILAEDNSTDLEFFHFHMKYLEQNNLITPDLLVHLRPTTPLRSVKVIDSAIDKMKKDKEATALRSAHLTHLTPYKMFKKNHNYMRPFLKSDLAEEFYNLPRQAFEDAYIPNGYVDIVKTSIFKNTDILHGENIFLYETENTADIDIIEDFHFAEQILNEERFEEILINLKRFKESSL
ncbi:acylneuraminate cytidylyltransferase family protein [bacterium]|nr:acylneuraminate cytidylyltransferase family protein [bacterium]